MVIYFQNFAFCVFILNVSMIYDASFQVISLEGWTDIMYYVQDAHSFWDWIYFVLLIVVSAIYNLAVCQHFSITYEVLLWSLEINCNLFTPRIKFKNRLYLIIGSS